MKLKRKILYFKPIEFLISLIAICYIKLVFFTSRKIYVDKHHLEYAQKNSDNLILAFWHGRLLMLVQNLSNIGHIHALTSQHRDGNFIANVTSAFNAKIIRGSSNKGGATALKEILKALKQKNHNLTIAVDGPRGPRMRVQGAVIDIARLSGATIIPVSYSCKRQKIINSWDRFILPSLFNEITFNYGEVIKIDKKAPKEEIQKKYKLLEDQLNQLTWDLDKKYYHPKIAPEK